jgi:PilZ domain-containing protein
MPQLEQRISSRLTCSFELQLSTSDGRSTGTVEARDISLMGLGFRHCLGEGSLGTGQAVKLALVGYDEVEATVRWSDAECAGVKFSDCLDHVWDSWVVKALPNSRSKRLSLN